MISPPLLISPLFLLLFNFPCVQCAPPAPAQNSLRFPGPSSRAASGMGRASMFGRSASRLPSRIEPGPQDGVQPRTRPTLAALAQPPQEQFVGPPGRPSSSVGDAILPGQPSPFPNSPGLEGRSPQAGRGTPPGFGPQGPDSEPLLNAAPFEADDGLFEARPLPPEFGARQPILPVRPRGRPPPASNLEEAIPPPPAEEGDEAMGEAPPALLNQLPDGGVAMPNEGPPPFDPNSRLPNPNAPPDPNLGDPSTFGRGPIMPVRPPNRPPSNSGGSGGGIGPVRPGSGGGGGQGWNISDAEAAGLINGEDLNASQEGRCVVCGPRNQFSVVDPVAAQTARPGQIPPPASYEDETEAGVSVRL